MADARVILHGEYCRQFHWFDVNILSFREFLEIIITLDDETWAFHMNASTVEQTKGTLSSICTEIHCDGTNRVTPFSKYQLCGLFELKCILPWTFHRQSSANTYARHTHTLMRSYISIEINITIFPFIWLRILNLFFTIFRICVHLNACIASELIAICRDSNKF